MDENIKKEIENIIKDNKVVLFMKGNKNQARCGFSSQVVQILNSLNIEFKDINILDSMDLREGIKEYSNWPTIPQLYIKEKFIGGCDIITEMFESNELKTLFE